MTLDIPIGVQSLIRIMYGTFMCLWAVSLWRNRSRILVSKTWGGYIEASPTGDRIHHPAASIALLALWTFSMICLALGVYPFYAAAVNLILCRHFFIGLRWRSLARGCGAPGFIANWLATAVFLLELTSLLNTLPELRLAAVRMLRVDFACIFLSAGFYKFFSGYNSGSGMEYGMVNPMWGYWHRYFSKLDPRSPFFKILNFFAWSMEIVAAILMLIPVFLGWGGLLFSAIFIFIMMQIRLGFLCHMAVLIGCIYSTSGDTLSTWVSSIGPAQMFSNGMVSFPTDLQHALSWAFTIHTFLIPVCFVGIWFNHLGRRRLSSLLQPALDRYANLFGVVIWRVFSSDLTRFEVKIFTGLKTGALVQSSRFGEGVEFIGERYQQVFEAITVVCLFTSLNYYPDQKELFHAKLVRYAKTFGPTVETVRYDIHVIGKRDGAFIRDHVADYTVDVASGTVIENERIPEWIHPVGPTLVHAARKPGSYAAWK